MRFCDHVDEHSGLYKQFLDKPSKCELLQCRYRITEIKVTEDMNKNDSLKNKYNSPIIPLFPVTPGKPANPG